MSTLLLLSCFLLSTFSWLFLPHLSPHPHNPGLTSWWLSQQDVGLLQRKAPNQEVSVKPKSRWVPSPSQATGAVQLILLERHMENALNLTWHNDDLSISSLLNFTLTVPGSLIALDFSFETSLIHLAKLHPKLLPSFAFAGLFTRWMCEINHSF